MFPLMSSSQINYDLVRDEGCKPRLYTDSVGKQTIGVGRNLTDGHLSDDEITLMLNNDVATAEAQLDARASWWRNMSEPRRRGLLNMCFNMGWPKLSGFALMLSALQRGDYATAYSEALSSKWAQQVGDRAVRIAKLFADG